MATKAEVEKQAKLIWERVARKPSSYPDAPWRRTLLFRQLAPTDKKAYLAIARWHLRKVEAAKRPAYARGYDAGHKDGYHSTDGGLA